MYRITLKYLENAKPVSWVFHEDTDTDLGYYIAACPDCGKEFKDSFDRPSVCPECGAKLCWCVFDPDIDKDEIKKRYDFSEHIRH